MSRGRPTKLVRDGGTESYDPPPDLPLPGELVRVPDHGDPDDPSDLRRYGESDQEQPYDAWRAKEAGMDAISGGAAILDEPRGDR